MYYLVMNMQRTRVGVVESREMNMNMVLTEVCFFYTMWVDWFYLFHLLDQGLIGRNSEPSAVQWRSTRNGERDPLRRLDIYSGSMHCKILLVGCNK